MVADALAGAAKGNGLDVDAKAVHDAALLHDVGRMKTHGIAHGLAGAVMLRGLGFREGVARAVETHVGYGISSSDARRAGMPEKNYFPLTIEEKIVCIADKLSGPGKSERIIRACRNNGSVKERMGKITGDVAKACGGKLETVQEYNAMLVAKRNGKFLVMKRRRPEVWEFPGGGIEWGESPANAAEREFFEETGLKASAGMLLCVTSAVYWKDCALKHSVYIVFAAKPFPGKGKPKLGPEHSAFSWASPGQLKNLVLGLNSKPVLGFIKGE
jgi:uncharacterized protein (TIGR00295 family)